jgi:hypothetical protein
VFGDLASQWGIQKPADMSHVEYQSPTKYTPDQAVVGPGNACTVAGKATLVIAGIPPKMPQLVEYKT